MSQSRSRDFMHRTFAHVATTAATAFSSQPVHVAWRFFYRRPSMAEARLAKIEAKLNRKFLYSTSLRADSFLPCSSILWAVRQ